MYIELSTGGLPHGSRLSAPGAAEEARARSAGAPHAAHAKAERRRARRYAIDAAIKVNDQAALAIDLSRGGVFFESDQPYQVGERVSLLLPYEHPGGGTSVSCTARVVRIEPRGEFHGVAAAYDPVARGTPA